MFIHKRVALHHKVMIDLNTEQLIFELRAKNFELQQQNTNMQLINNEDKEALEELKLFYDFTALGYLTLNGQNKIISINSSGEHLFQKTASELINSNFFNLIPTEFHVPFELFLKQTKASSAQQSCSIKLIINNASAIYVDFTGLYIPTQRNYILQIKNVSKKVHFKNLLSENDFFFNETQRLGILGTYKINITTDTWDVSDMLATVFGIKQKDILNFDYWLAIIHPADRKAMESYFTDKIKNKTAFNIEYRIIRQSDQQVRWIDSRGEFITVNNDQEVLLFGIIQDITESKLLTEKMQLAEIRSNSIFKSSKEGILMLDAVSGQITDVNPFLISLIGFNYQELVGKELWEIGTFKNIAASKEAFIELQNKEYIRFENMPLETKSGKSIDVEFVSNIYLVEQKKVILCHIRDISDRKKIAEALKISGQMYFAMFEKNQAAQLLIDPADGGIVDANSAAAQFYKYSLVQLKSMNLSDISTLPNAEVIAELETYGQDGQFYFQYVHKLSSGKTCDIEMYTSPLLIDGRSYLIATINDITKRKLEEERVSQLNNQLNLVNALKSQFISTVSHEFRTPLAGILSSVQLLKIYNDSWDNEKKEKMYKQIFDAVQHTKSLLDDVSLIDEAQNSRSFFRPSAIELAPLINEIIEENLAISGTNHTVIFKNHTTLKTCFMDAVMIRHIFNNIVSNAIKYCDESKHIFIDIYLADNQKIKFEIQDQGIGIPPEELTYLIEPFYRASNTGAIQGTGFGMSIVKRFVKLHNGELLIESELHKGTTVTVTLPYT